MNYSKVLLFGQTFNDFSGGGITLAGLFKDWPKEKLAVISYPFMIHNSTTNICNNYYQIGEKELVWKFPFSLVKQKFPSGRVEIRNRMRVTALKETKSLRHLISSRIFMPTLRWSGLIHRASSIHLSTELKKFLSDFAPEVIYLQISNYESIRFSLELLSYLKIPSIIHMMDDWPSTISNSGLFKNFWEKRIDKDLRLLLDKIDMHLSISEAMSEEYKKRYGITFIPFHNPIEYQLFEIESDISGEDDNVFKILYVGRIGTANKDSLLDFAELVSTSESFKTRIRFDIFTKDYDSYYVQKINKLKNVGVYEAVAHNEVPKLLKSYNLLFLPLDFSESGRKFSMFSMPTKASEYMASGTPILLYAPPDTAISKFCKQHECGHCVSTQDYEELRRSILLLSTDREYCKKIGSNAQRFAYQQFDGQIVRRMFKGMISELNRVKH